MHKKLMLEPPTYQSQLVSISPVRCTNAEDRPSAGWAPSAFSHWRIGKNRTGEKGTAQRQQPQASNPVLEAYRTEIMAGDRRGAKGGTGSDH